MILKFVDSNKISLDAKHFTYATEFFFDPEYFRACHCKTSSEGTKVEFGIISGPLSCQPAGCCETVVVGSTGSLASGVQKHVVGTYDKVDGIKMNR